MAAPTMSETATSRPGRSQSRNSSRSDLSPKQTSPSRSPSRQRTVSFSEQAHPNHSLRSTSPDSPANREANTKNPTAEISVIGQDHDRAPNRQPTTTSLDQPSSSSSSASSSQQSHKQPWYRRLAANYHSISLENTGSVARDHLALERTFLAWLRTSLAFASIGVAITQLFRLNSSLAEEKRRNLDTNFNSPRNEAAAGDGAGSPSLPLSPLMGASLTPEIYTQIEQLLQQQQYPILHPSQNSASNLLDQLLYPTEFDSGSAAKLRHLGKPLGATFLGISIIILFIGFHRYFESQHWIIRGQFPASRGSVALVGLVAVMLMVASLVVVLVVAPSVYNK